MKLRFFWQRRGGRCIQGTLAVIVVMLATLAPSLALAGPGSLIAGVVWADANRDGVRQSGEVVKSDVTVELLSSPGGGVVAMTTTDAGGAYSFADVPDGDYRVRVTAPGAFAFPAASGGDNDFASTGPPGPGQPERGQSAPVTIAGATQVSGLDAGMRPVGTLLVDRLVQPDSCEGFASTGTAPFDDNDDPGNDSGPGNCIVRTEDTVTQVYSVSLDGLRTGTSVDNVIAEFVISSPDGASFELAGEGSQGMPSACLSAAQGVAPPSSWRRNPDGSITVTCNLGTFENEVASMRLVYRVNGDSAIPSHVSVAMRAYAAGGDAATSDTVQGPVVEVTGSAQWELSKQSYRAPRFRPWTIDGQLVDGYYLEYQIRIFDTSDGGTGGGELEWPVTFTDRMTEFPNARIVTCRPTNLADSPALRSPWTPTCEQGPQGDDGWEISIRPNSGRGTDTRIGFIVIGIFIPQEDMNRAIDAGWQPGDDYATGPLAFANEARDTDGWTMRGGQPNHGDGFEPGWDGNVATGDNLVQHQIESEAPQWDLAKNLRTTGFQTRVIDGQEVDGYYVEYGFTIRDLAGPDNVAPWLDRPVTFTDRLVDYPNAVLVLCRNWPDSRNRTTGEPTCENGPQGDDGWGMSFTPNQRGFDLRTGQFIVGVFIPAETIHANPCDADPALTFSVTNEAINTEHWTAGGVPNNGTGFEPGWDGQTATGNNVVTTAIRIRPSDAQCGRNPQSFFDKQYMNIGGEAGINPMVAGKVGGSQVRLTTNADAEIVNPMLCDVFDVSILKIRDDHPWTAGGWTNADGITRLILFTNSVSQPVGEYLVEYAIGPNANDTQAGAPNAAGQYPFDVSPNQQATAGCEDHAGPWSTDPAADFGADWQDRVNMVRLRPIDPATVLPPSSDLRMYFPFEVRYQYNGGPNAGEPIPGGVSVFNHGGGTSIVVVNGRIVDQGWRTLDRRLFTSEMTLAIGKNVSPTQYLPGARVVWNIDLRIDNAALGATMFNIRVEDTLPEGMQYDAACTQNLLPDGVTAAYNPATHQVTFTIGNREIVRSPSQWLYNSNPNVAAEALRICGTVDSLAQPGETLLNRVQVSADNSGNAPAAQASVQVVGSGQMGISKSVDKPFVASGEEYVWSVRWGNTSNFLAVQNPDVIDVLPWNGDSAEGALSKRDQFGSSFTGTAQLTGALAAPVYTASTNGSTGAVPGVWYYATAAPATINHDPRDVSNADPQAAGGLWLNEAEIAAGAGFGAVTAVRFVSGEFLLPGTQVRALIPAVSVSSDLDNVYVNRAMIFSGTFANQPLLSNEPYVLMPGFTLGDLVWRDNNGDGLFNGGEAGIAGVAIEVLDGNGAVVTTRTTDAAGRWFVDRLPAGTYLVRIPATMFHAGGPLEHFRVSPAGSSGSQTGNENLNNNNTSTPVPGLTGLVSAPVTFEYVRDGDGNIIGANAPVGDNVAGLGNPLIPDQFTNFTVDLALLPIPGVDIEKSTNTLDADEPTGAPVRVGDPVVWRYVVTNTGITNLTNVTVTDDQLDAAQIDCGNGTNVVAGPLAPGESFACTARGVAVEGQYANTGSVTGDAPDGTEVDDRDPSHHFGVRPAVDIEKSTNTFDADEPTGPIIALGDTVVWQYVVTNTGNVDLTDLVVSDDRLDAAAIDCGHGSNTVVGPLAPGASFTCTARGVAAEGQYQNTATVVGSGPATVDENGDPVPPQQVQDQDPSHHFGIRPAVDIEKSTNTFDADEGTGPRVAVGGVVVWLFVVTNTGNVDLTDLVVSDDRLDPADIDCGNGSNTVAGPLQPGGTFTCTALGVAADGQYVNTGRVSADGPETVDENGDPKLPRVEDTDISHHFGAVPAVDIEKSTNTVDADEAPGVSVTIGDAVLWTYVVTNTGNVELTNIVVTDDQLPDAAIDCGGSNVVAGPLAPGESFTCTAQGVAVDGQYVNTGRVSADGPETVDENGDPVPPQRVDDDDPSHHTGQTPAGEQLAATGGQARPLVIAAAAALLTGTLLLLVLKASRRRNHHSHH